MKEEYKLEECALLGAKWTVGTFCSFNKIELKSICGFLITFKKIFSLVRGQVLLVT